MANKGIFYIAATFYGAGRPGLGDGVSHSNQWPFYYRQSDVLAQFLHQQGRLIIAALAQSLRVQRHGHQYLALKGMGTQVLGQKLTQRSGYRLKVPVLELKDSLANCALEQEGGAYAVYG
jgi:hypothetical protein